MNENFQLKGFDATLDPAYFAWLYQKFLKSSVEDEEIRKLQRQIDELKKTVNGDQSTEGLVEKVESLQEAVAEIQENYPLIFYDTTENWNSHPEILAQRAAIYVYSNARIYEGVPIPDIKIGNGNSYLIDLPFIDSDILSVINNYTPVSQEDKMRWDNKINCDIDERFNLLIFNRN